MSAGSGMLAAVFQIGTNIKYRSLIEQSISNDTDMNCSRKGMALLAGQR